jgi:cytoskeleton protein RodZ
MTDAVITIGPRLKAERERRGLSAQKAADELHLDGWVIDALEAEDYERVGPAVYAKGHLKRYAALLGLPAAEIMAGYESRSQAPRTPPPPANVRLRTDTPAVSNLPWPQILGSLAVLLLVLGVLWWKPWHQRGTAPGAAAPVTAAPAAAAAAAASSAGLNDGATEGPGQPAAATPPSAGAPGAPGAPAAALAAAAGAQAAPAEGDAVAGAGRARLRLSFSADSWVDIHDAIGRRTFAGKGRANTVRTVAGPAPLRVYLGYASGVQLEINNRAVAIGRQFLAGDVARFEAGADGVLRRDSHSAASTGAAAPGVAVPARPTG